MLERLNIRNIVLVEAADIAFASGLNVLSGETGAGKSILLDALGLIFGERSDAALVRAGQDQASVCAEFSVNDQQDILTFLSEHGIVADTHVIIRRTLDVNGRSRAFINDAPVTITLLKALANLLVEQHNQHDERLITDTHKQRDMLDHLAGASRERDLCAEAFTHYEQTKLAYTLLQERIEKTERERAFLSFMAEEIAALNPVIGEEQTLADLRAKMQQQEKAQSHIADAIKALNEPKEVSAQVRASLRALDKIPASALQDIDALKSTLDRASCDIADVTAQLESWLEQVPQTRQLEQSEERLFALRAVARKYHTQVDALPALLENTRQQLAELDSQDLALSDCKKAIQQAKEKFLEAAQVLHEKRQQAAHKCEKAIIKELVPLKMQKTRLQFVFEPLPETLWNAFGTQRIMMMASTNEGVPLAPLSAIASGGELSRLMLAIKVVMRKKNKAGLYVFDEIDTGTGGAVADAIGARLQALAEDGQVLVVTHAPQVAARGAHHLFISKNTHAGKTLTKITPLKQEARMNELARMLSGSEITQEARSAAKRLLAAAH